jgi:hypothetical protein
MKFLQKIVIVIFIIGVVGYFFHNAILKFALERMAHQLLGLNVRIETLDLSFKSSTLQIQHLEVSNPRGFSSARMIDMPQITLQLEPRGLLRGKVHLKEINVYLREMLVEKNENGAVNLNALKVVRTTEGTIPVSKRSPSEHRDIRIDRAFLKIDKVVYKDFSQTPPYHRGFPIFLNEQYDNITDVKSLAQLIIVKALAKTTIATLTGFDLYHLSRSVESVVGFVPQKALEKTATQTKKILKDAGNAVEKAVDSLKEMFNQ